VVERGFQLVELPLDGRFVVLVAPADQLLAGFRLGFALGVLRGGNLRLERPPPIGAPTVPPTSDIVVSTTSGLCSSTTASSESGHRPRILEV
jgi:hypothetical protein